MKLHPTLAEALNRQFGAELESFLLYLGMSAWCEDNDLPGFAHWLRIQSEEERSHAMRLFTYLADRGEKIIVPVLPQMPSEFDSILALYTVALEYEDKLLADYNRLYPLAAECNDYPTQIFLQWFLEEQVEEVKEADLIVAQLTRIGNSQGNLYHLDRHFAKRTSEDSELPLTT
jgi:ferritin